MLLLSIHHKEDKEWIHKVTSYKGLVCAVRYNFRITQQSAITLEKRHAVMPPGFALQAVGMVLQANIDFLKIGWIEVTFLKIARIFLNQNMPRRDLVRKYM